MKLDLSRPPLPKNATSRSSGRDLFIRAQEQAGGTVTPISAAAARAKIGSHDTVITGSPTDQQKALEFINAHRAESGVAPLSDINNIAGSTIEQSDVQPEAPKAKVTRGRKRKADLEPMQVDVPAPPVQSPLPEMKVEFILPIGSFSSNISAMEVSGEGQIVSIWYPADLDSLFKPAAGVELQLKSFGATFNVVSSGIHIVNDTFDCGVSIFFNKPTHQSE